jgi:hypothetical protein
MNITEEGEELDRSILSSAIPKHMLSESFLKSINSIEDQLEEHRLKKMGDHNREKE